MRLNLKAMDHYLAEEISIRSNVEVMIMVWLLLLCLVRFVMRLQSRRIWKMGNLSRKEHEQIQSCAEVSVEKVTTITEIAPFRRNLVLYAGTIGRIP